MEMRGQRHEHPGAVAAGDGPGGSLRSEGEIDLLDEGTSAVVVRTPVIGDGMAVARLAAATATLDVNSAYAYVLWCRDFAQTSVVAELADPPGEADGPELVGFVTGYRRPSAPDTLFVWQVAVSDRMRRRGLGVRLLIELIERVRTDGVNRVEATVAPNNHASRRLFAAVAQRLGAPCRYPTLGGFDDQDLPEGHDPEPLLSIGPL